MARIKKAIDFSSNDKVMHYLQNSKHYPTINTLAMLSKSPRDNSILFQQRLRSCSENDSISTSSSSSIIEDLSQSNFTRLSSLSDPVAHCSITSSNPSSEEDMDFNLGFDQISNYDDVDDDDDDYQYHSKSNVDAITLHGENGHDELLRQSSDSTVCKDDYDLDNNASNLQKPTKFFHDSTHTLCSEELFSPYTTNDHDDGDEEQITGLSIRSNSVSVFQFSEKPTLLETAPKKMVRFADVMGLDLESIRYMSPPDQMSSTILQECVRVQFGQLRHGKYLLDLPNIARRTPSSSSFSLSAKQYNLVSRNFTSRTNINPIIYNKQVLLECLYTKDAIAYGTIRVHNCNYNKHVFIRSTDNEWNTWTDIEARHSMNCPHDNTDTFTFEIVLPKSKSDVLETKRILFAVCFQTTSEEFWDNNQGWNYVLDVIEKR